MSRCISSYGEYSSHELEAGNRCGWCRVWECPLCGECEPYPLDGDDHDCDPDMVRADRFHAGSTEADYDFGPTPPDSGSDS